MLCQLRTFDDPNLLSAAIPFADAGIYRLSDELALVQSVDFFTPVVDDPADYGRIAAANALSDIYAIGGKPLTTMNLVAFPAGREADLVLVLNGGAEKVAEAGATMVGGHTIEDAEPKYGLSVTGLVDPRKMISTVGARPGDRLVLTKPIGTGILTTAFKGGVLSAEELAPAVAGMIRLNRLASEAMQEVGVSACTDITGFGLLGHASELAEASGVGLRIDLTALPLYPQVREMAACGLIPGGSYKNREFYLPKLIDAGQLPVEALDLLADPQTSGGLLIALAPDKVEALLTRLRAGGEQGWIIGEVTAGPAGRLQILQGSPSP